ncbi:PREDICTED: hydroxysteroid 11-beta-dehydrogenase 1-like protein isoform X2 [Miniopterus natalensis]|uniref:hydroxysteroid 11-beta-dehydrogenase 1-like protein isoform X2 n=1 Tax=Miniopterus natalensis TaxID=291302 RepID=UPI0007A6ADB7|nr:PREDICTED: hydroxysteroid 11-beta-dehydrogenase 1-like protein isoform X2 [Miniopterus natalensis]
MPVWAPTWCSLPTPRRSCRRRAGLPRAEPPRCCPGRHAGPQCARDELAPAGELPELRATNFVRAAQSDRQQGLPGGGVLAARPRAQVLLQPLFGGQVCTGQFLWLPAAGTGCAGCECGHHHVCPGPPGSCLNCGGSQGCRKDQGGCGAQGSPRCDSRRCHSRLPRLLPLALPHALPSSGLAASPKGLVHPPGAQCHCLSSWGGAPSSSQRGTSSSCPEGQTKTDTSERVAKAQDSVINTGKENQEKLLAPGNNAISGCESSYCVPVPCQGLGRHYLSLLGHHC